MSAEGQRRFATERGGVQIREVDPRGWDWDVLPLGGAVRRVTGLDVAAAEARKLSKTSSEWRRGDLAGEDAAREGVTKYGRGHGEHGLRDLQANLRVETRGGTVKDFDRGYVVGYERGLHARGVAAGSRPSSMAGRVDPGFSVDYAPGRTYPPLASSSSARDPSRREIEDDVAGIVEEGGVEDRLFRGGLPHEHRVRGQEEAAARRLPHARPSSLPDARAGVGTGGLRPARASRGNRAGRPVDAGSPRAAVLALLLGERLRHPGAVTASRR